jgi:hypothetical protein
MLKGGGGAMEDDDEDPMSVDSPVMPLFVAYPTPNDISTPQTGSLLTVPTRSGMMMHHEQQQQQQHVSSIPGTRDPRQPHPMMNPPPPAPPLPLPIPTTFSLAATRA